MTDAESALDSLRAYTFAVAVQRLRLVVAGDVLAREDEPLDLLVLAKLKDAT